MTNYFQLEYQKKDEELFYYEEMPCIDLKTKKLIDWNEKKKTLKSLKTA